MTSSWPRRMGQLVLDLFSPVEDKPPETQSNSDQPDSKSFRIPRAISPLPATPALRIGEPWGARGGNLDNDLSDMTIVFSSRLKRSWRLEHPRGPLPVLHLPKGVAAAPDAIWEALASWVRSSRKPFPGSRAQSRKAAQEVFAWLGERTDRAPVGDGQGLHHDLVPIFDRLNRDHFQGRLSAIVRWSPKPGGLSTHRTLQLAGGPTHVITIGQIYDHKDVPLFAVEGVLFHEMLHIELPPRGDGARRHVHHAQFRQAERAYPGYQAWKEWELREAHRLLRALRRASARTRRKRSP